MNAIYVRLSKEDSRRDESNSITNQKILLERHAKENGFIPYIIFTDDDYTGLNTHRPAFQEMLARCESGEIKTVIVKDMSRFGRNYLEVGYITEITFPRLEVRLISVLDCEDSANGMGDFAPFRNILNELYSRDISKKVKAGLRAKAMSGKPLSGHVYGYIKQEGKWVLDEIAAPVVKEIFTRYVGGESYAQICRTLTEQGYDTPSKHLLSTGMKRKYNNTDGWAISTVTQILDNPVYIGTTKTLITEKISFKDKKKRKTEKPIVTENTHEPIIDSATWETAQRLRGSRRRITKKGDVGVLSGLVYCKDCSRRMYVNTSENENNYYRYYICSGYRQKGKQYCTRHSIRADVLEAAVLSEIQMLFKKKVDFEKVFETAKKANDTISSKKAKNERRKAEIDIIIRKLYEDYALGRISAERFDKMLADYEKEQEGLKRPSEKSKADPLDFVKLVKKFTCPSELTAEMARQLIEKVYIYEDKTVHIVWAFVGEIK